MYGHRSDHGVAFWNEFFGSDQYANATENRECGSIWSGKDVPKQDLTYPAGTWTFQLRVIDTCKWPKTDSWADHRIIEDGRWNVVAESEFKVIWP
jgi:hypothetical protein